jgi:hypothetical protein
MCLRLTGCRPRARTGSSAGGGAPRDQAVSRLANARDKPRRSAEGALHAAAHVCTLKRRCLDTGRTRWRWTQQVHDHPGVHFAVANQRLTEQLHLPLRARHAPNGCSAGQMPYQAEVSACDHARCRCFSVYLWRRFRAHRSIHTGQPTAMWTAPSRLFVFSPISGAGCGKLPSSRANISQCIG